VPFVNDSEDNDGDGFCSNIPTRHVVDILYTTVEGPVPQGGLIHRICGVRTRLDSRNKTFDNMKTMQTVFLESVVMFTKVPLVDKASQS
ncbi:hypothetical protein L9F63_001205, partial [Diploptera punctata]